MAPEFCISYSSANSLPSACFVKFAIGKRLVAELVLLCTRNSTADLLSIKGFVLGFKATAVKPLFAATSKP